MSSAATTHCASERESGYRGLKGVRHVLKQTKMSLGILTSALALGLAAPAMAHSEVQPDRYETTIAKAKSLMMADSGSALSLAREARALVKDNSSAAEKNRLTAQWLEGEALMRLNRADEAASTIESALAIASQSFQEEKIHADLLRSAASLRAREGNFKQALTYFRMANDRYESLGDARSQAIVLQNIGSLYSHARDYEQVLQYYRMASEVYTDTGPLKLSAHNNIGNALKGLGRYEEAEQEFGEALSVAKSMNSPMLEARILTNAASTQSLRGSLAEAEATAEEALRIAQEHAPTWKPFIFGVLAQIEFDRDNLDMAEDFVGRTFADQKLDSTNALFRDFHETASKVYSRKGNSQLAALHSAAVARLDDQATKLGL